MKEAPRKINQWFPRDLLLVLQSSTALLPCFLHWKLSAIYKIYLHCSRARVCFARSISPCQKLLVTRRKRVEFARRRVNCFVEDSRACYTRTTIFFLYAMNKIDSGDVYSFGICNDIYPIFSSDTNKHSSAIPAINYWRNYEKILFRTAAAHTFIYFPSFLLFCLFGPVSILWEGGHRRLWKIHNPDILLSYVPAYVANKFLVCFADGISFKDPICRLNRVNALEQTVCENLTDI